MKSIANFVKNSLLFSVFIIKACIRTKFRNHIKKDKSGEINVLANGPSLKDNLYLFNEMTETIVLNFFAFDNSFYKIKPKHYCLADPLFFESSSRIDDIKKLYSIFEEITWNMTIYVPTISYKAFINFSQLKNKNINVIKVNNIEYKGYDCFRHFFYRRNIAIPKIQTVAIMAIYIALLKGYDNVKLYGMEHSFFESLCVNDKNQLCRADTHFYNIEDEKVKITPLVYPDGKTIWKISDFVYAISEMFKNHDRLALFSKSINSSIINHTKNSFIDSYERTN